MPPTPTKTSWVGRTIGASRGPKWPVHQKYLVFGTDIASVRLQQLRSQVGHEHSIHLDARRSTRTQEVRLRLRRVNRRA
jgi:hypothetical protein